ncbi:MAG: S8 family serine peptidase [Phycisphaerales bacterium]|nr:S8 family serine peptidase [Phycisphaerales bacterium]
MRIRRLVGLVSAAVIGTHAAADVIDPNLQNEMDAVGPDGTVSAIVYLNEQVDIPQLSADIAAQRLTRPHRHQIVVDTLRDVAMQSQAALVDRLQVLGQEGQVDRFDAFWITNAIRVDGRPDVMTQLSKRDDVLHIYFNYGIELIEPVERGPIQHPNGAHRGASPIEEGVVAVRAPEVWDMGITGEGSLVATLDTGVDGSHEALYSRWAGLRPEYNGNPQWAFYDPYNGNHGNPYDSGSHGTHTMGTVCGGSPGQSIGVAPGAHWISSAGIDQGGIGSTVTSAMAAFEWFADPDGFSFTTWDVPHVCSNSWGLTSGHGYPDCDQTFWTFLDNLEAAGCVVLFSAGNEGTSGLRRPGDRASDPKRTVAVAAIDPHYPSYPIASFSSRGPTNCTESGAPAIKPDISGPGVDTLSCVPGGGYSEYSGTSMASPAVNGVVALIVQANPDLDVDTIKEILYSTSMDLGPFGEDNDYGNGLVDAYEAVLQALSTVSLSWSFPSGRPEWLEPTGGEEIEITISGQQATPDPGTATLHVVLGGGVVDIPMPHDGGANFRAVFPELPCNQTVTYWFSIETTDGDVSYSPYAAPNATYSGLAISGYEESFKDDFQSDLGWTVYAGAGTGNWVRAIPAEGGDRCDPGSDSDGSGYCFVTGNAGDEDVDDGTTILTSPALDASADSALLEYDFWYNNGSSCAGADPLNDVFVVEISDDGGLTWLPLETVGPTGSEVSGGWINRAWLASEIPGVDASNPLRIRFTVGDLNDGSVIEAGVDNVRIGYYYCNEELCPGDFDNDGVIGVNDILFIISAWQTPDGDINDDGTTNVDDILLLLGAFGDEC